MSEKRYERVFLDTNEFTIFDKQEEHRDKGSLYLSENNILKLLNEQDNEIKQLKKELALMKDKAYHYGDLAICETSSDFDKDMDKLRKEIYGEEAEQIKQQEINEKQESYKRLKEQGLVKVNCYVCKYGVWFGSEEGLTCEKEVKPFPNECKYFIDSR